MLNSSIKSVDSSTVFKPKTSQVHLLSTAISKLGDSSFISQNRDSKNLTPVRTRLFRESPKSNKLEHVVVGQYHILTPTHVVFSLDRSASPKRLSHYNESPERANTKLHRFENWNSRLDIELQLQNNKITKMNNELTYNSHQPYNHRSTKSAVFSGNTFPKFQSRQSDMNQLASKLNSIPTSQINNFAYGHQNELNALQYSLSRIMKTSRY